MKTFLSSLLFLITLFANSQNWQGVGGGMNFWVEKLYADSVSDVLYATGAFSTAGGTNVNRIAKWNDTAWSALATGISSNAKDFCWYNSEFYVGGGFLYVQGGTVWSPGLAKWDGVKWDSLPIQPFPTGNGAILDLMVYNNELYVSGIFDTIAGIPANSIAKWNGSAWSTINFPYGQQNPAIITSMAMYNGDLYIGGNIDDTLYGEMYRYDGANWYAVGNGIFGAMAQVNKLIVYKNELYVAGSFSQYEYSGNPGNTIAKWNGSTWSDVAGGTSYICLGCAQIFDMTIFNNNLYVVGTFDSIGGIYASRIAYWDSTKWCSLGTTFNYGLSSVAVYNNELYIACGKLIDTDTMNYIAQWTGGSFTDTCGNTSAVNETNSSSQISIYPNPTTGIFTITSTEKISSIRITNIIGQEIYHLTIQPFNHSTIDLSTHPKGIYFLKVISEGNIYTQKIIIQ